MYGEDRFAFAQWFLLVFGMFHNCVVAVSLFIFFFQAEDGIRDLYVTGVQTCALPISLGGALSGGEAAGREEGHRRRRGLQPLPARPLPRQQVGRRGRAQRNRLLPTGHRTRSELRGEIGRASCRERVESCATSTANQAE